MASKPSKLSQKQWLNIIIIVTSAMFLLMVLVGKMLEKASKPELTEEVSLDFYKLDLGDFSLRNENGKWISTANWLTTGEAESLVQRWKSILQRQAISKDLSEAVGKTVLIYLNKSMSPVICKLIQNDQELIFQFVQSDQQVHLEDAKLTDYIPVE